MEHIIQALKNEYQELYKTEFKSGAVFIWRPLSPYEFKMIYNNENLKSWEKEHIFCEMCMLYAKIDGIEYNYGEYDFTCGAGGYATLLSGQIINLSGFGEDDTAENILIEMRDQLQSFENQIPCIIKAAFGNEVNFDEIETWSIRKIMYYLSRAEFILSFKVTLSGTNIPMPQMKPIVQNKKVKARNKEELEKRYQELQNIEWKEISEQEFLRMSPPDSYYDPELDPELYNRR